MKTNFDYYFRVFDVKCTIYCLLQSNPICFVFILLRLKKGFRVSCFLIVGIFLEFINKFKLTVILTFKKFALIDQFNVFSF